MPKKHFFIVKHDGRFKTLWDWFVLILMMFTAIYIPYSSAFNQDNTNLIDMIKTSKIDVLVLIGTVVDFMFFLDILINFRTTYIDSKSDELITEPKLLVKHYLRTWFLIDFLAAIPFDWMTYSLEKHESKSVSIVLL